MIAPPASMDLMDEFLRIRGAMFASVSNDS